MDRVKFIIAEQSYLIRKGVASIINRIDHATVVKELDNLNSVNSAIQKYKPDFLVLNPNLLPHHQHFRNFQINMEMSEKIIAITTIHPHRKGLISNFRENIDIGDNKETIFNKLQNIVEATGKGNASRITSNELSDREKTILTYVAKGFTNKEIAEKLFLSTHTVITHRKNITAKLGIKTISGLTVYAILNNLIKMEELK